MEDKIQIQVLFSRTTDTGLLYTDALYFSPEQYAALKPAELAAMKQARFDAWLKIIQTPAPDVPVTEQIDNINDQIDQLTQQKQDLLADNQSGA